MTTLNDIEFDAAWSSSEVKMLLGGVRSDSERRALKGELFWRRAEMGADIAVARAAADELNARAFALRREIRAEAFAGRHGERFVAAFLFTLFLGFVTLGAVVGGWEWAKAISPVWSAPLTSPPWVFGLWGLGLVAVLTMFWETIFALWVAPRRQARLGTEKDLASIEAAETAAVTALRTHIATTVSTYLAEAINNRAAPRHAASMQAFLPGGPGSPGRNAAIGVSLSEVARDDNLIATEPQERVVDMIARLPGGSIGISGPRGVGKSTLLRSICSARETVTGRQIIAVETAAPVEYQARDFLLYLFASLCRRVLKEERIEPEHVEADSAEEEMENWQSASWRARLVPTKILLGFIGLALLTASLAIASLGAVIQSEVAASQAAASRTAALKASAAGKIVGAKAAGDKAAQGAGAVKPVAAVPEVAVAAASPAAAPNALTLNAPNPLGVEAGPFFGLGLLALLLAVGLALTEQREPRLRPMPWPIGPRRERLAARYMREARNPALARRSADELKVIRFQRSYTTGWSGSLKIPAGVELGSTAGLTLQQQAESLPELVERFRSYVAEVAAFYGTVIFGIDELDKLRTVAEGEAFLNGVKSVFGIENTFYLISVSEDALSAFDRRGIGIRDAFDSALDEIILVDFLGLDQARALLGRRILRLPDPFLQLCHMLAGGLPRDLIRHARQLLEITTAKKDQRILLRDAVRRLVASDLEAKLRATQVAIKGLKELPQTNALLEQIAKLPHEGALNFLSGRLFDLRDHLKEIERGSDEDRRLARLADELVAYTETMILVRRVGAAMDSKYGWELVRDGALADHVARARQALEVSVPLAEARIAETKALVADVANKTERHVSDANKARLEAIQPKPAQPKAPRSKPTQPKSVPPKAVKPGQSKAAQPKKAATKDPAG